jgi:hypothetical protein
MKCTAVWRLCLAPQGFLSAYKADFARFANDCYGSGLLRGRPARFPRHSAPGLNGIKFFNWFG